MSQYKGKTGGLEEAKVYMHDKEIPQLFESMMTALMFKKPENHLDFLEQCLVKAKKQDKVKWHTFIEPLPPIPRTENKLEQEKVADDVSNHQNAVKQTYSPLPPIAATVSVDNDDSSSANPSDTAEIGNTDDATTSEEQVTVESSSIVVDDQDTDAADNPSVGDNVDIGDANKDMDNDNTNKIETVEVVDDNVQVDSEDVTVLAEKNVEETEVNIEEDQVEVDTSVETEEKSSEQEEDTLAEVEGEGEVGTSVESEEISSEQESNTVTEVVEEDKGEVGTPVEDEEKSLELEAGTVAEVVVEDKGEVGVSVEDVEKSSEQEANIVTEVTEDDKGEVVTSVDNDEKISEPEASTETEVLEVPEWNDDSMKKDETSQAFSKPVIFVLGGPGSGKGTQCEKIVEKYSFLHLSAGDLLRQEATKGGEIAAIMEQGQLVPQEITIGLLKQAMLDSHEAKGFLIDGFPREIQQGQTFESEVTSPKLVLNYSCPDEILVERLLARGKHSGRVDDNEESIKKRLDLFHGKSEPVIGHYGDLVKTIDSSQPVDKVFEDTCGVLDQLSYNNEKNEIVVEEPIVAPVEEDVIPGRGQISHLFSDDIKNKSFVFVAGFEGSGKKEQCNNIVQNYGYTLISLDEILKAEVQTGTDRARVVSETLDNGGVLSDDVTMELIGEAILNVDNVDKILIDGFPRSVSEAEQFESQIATVKCFIYFSCLFETLIEKIGSSEHDSEIEKQLQSFHTTVSPVLEKYKERDMGTEISLQNSETDVTVSIQKIFGEPTNISTDNTSEFYAH